MEGGGEEKEAIAVTRYTYIATITGDSHRQHVQTKCNKNFVYIRRTAFVRKEMGRMENNKMLGRGGHKILITLPSHYARE